MQLASEIAQTAEPQHLVQFYDADHRAWAKSVGRYLAQGIRSGEAALVIATPEHTATIARQLRVFNCDPVLAESNGRLAFLDAAQTLAKFMLAGEPDWQQFQRAISGEIERVLAFSLNGGFRAYGEMVGVLWSAGKFAAAIRLEEHWNRLLHATSFKLFCGYPINVFADDFHHSNIDAVVRAHTHVVPTGEDGGLEWAVTRAIHEVTRSDVTRSDVTGSAIAVRLQPVLESSRHAHTRVPPAEAAIWGLRRALPEQASDIIAVARRYYESEKRFRALIENSSDAILLLDSESNVSYASASTARVLGSEPRELVGQNALGLVHPEDLETAQRSLEEARINPRSPVPVRARISPRAFDNNTPWRWVEGTFTNLTDDPDVRAVVVNYRDVTEQKAAEEKQKRDAEELVRYNTELESFAYAATHDLREPLRTVSAFTQLLIERTARDEENEKYARFILDSLAHMSAMLDDLLALTSVSSQDARRSVDLRSAVNQAIHYLERAIEESAASIAIGPLPVVLGNESQLTGLMQNLLGNAIKYRGREPLRIEVSADRLGSGWLVKVADNGIGIAPAYHEQIFGLFKRLQRSVPGTGIGLAICKKIVEGMSERIWVESELGRGSTFCFTVPSAPEN